MYISGKAPEKLKYLSNKVPNINEYQEVNNQTASYLLIPFIDYYFLSK